MIRIRGVNLPDNKRIEIALMAVYGVGRSRSNDILQAVGIDPNTRARDLTSTEAQKLRDYVEQTYVVEGELRREVAQHIKHLKDIGTYRGSRHMKHLPVRGQRTRTNTRTVRGNVRRTAGSGKRGSADKT